MEGDSTYITSYNTVKKMIKANLTDSITIDYSKLDERTASTIRVGLSRLLGERKREIERVLFTAK